MPVRVTIEFWALGLALALSLRLLRILCHKKRLWGITGDAASQIVRKLKKCNNFWAEMFFKV
jgi:hypothetical protein